MLRGASLSVARGEFLAVTGASGSGKSTLLHLLGALDVPDRGQVVFDGLNLFAGSAAERDHLRNVHFGFVFQFYHLLPELNTLENVLLPAMVRCSVLGWLAQRSGIVAQAATAHSGMNIVSVCDGPVTFVEGIARATDRDVPAVRLAYAGLNHAGYWGDTDTEAALADYTAVIEMDDAPAEQKAKALVGRGLTKGEAGDTEAALAGTESMSY